MYLLSRRRSFHLEQIADVSGITGGFQPVSKLALNHGDFFRVRAARHFLNHVFAKSGDELVFFVHRGDVFTGNTKWVRPRNFYW